MSSLFLDNGKMKSKSVPQQADTTTITTTNTTTSTSTGSMFGIHIIVYCLELLFVWNASYFPLLC